jgi:hypothetical protein
MVLSHLKGVGAELAAVLPDDDLPWYKKKHLVRLNACVISLIVLSSANGYDGSNDERLASFTTVAISHGYAHGRLVRLCQRSSVFRGFLTFPVVA